MVRMAGNEKRYNFGAQWQLQKAVEGAIFVSGCGRGNIFVVTSTVASQPMPVRAFRHMAEPPGSGCCATAPDEVFGKTPSQPLLCPMCSGQMRLIAFIIEGTQTGKILEHIGVDSEPPHISPARAPPLWDECGDTQMDDGAQIEPDSDLAAQPAPDYEVDQRISARRTRRNAMGSAFRRFFMVNLPHGQEIQGFPGIRSLFQGAILRLVCLKGLPFKPERSLCLNRPVSWRIVGNRATSQTLQGVMQWLVRLDSFSLL
jgi:hypothetical protein